MASLSAKINCLGVCGGIATLGFDERLEGSSWGKRSRPYGGTLSGLGPPESDQSLKVGSA